MKETNPHVGEIGSLGGSPKAHGVVNKDNQILSSQTDPEIRVQNQIFTRKTHAADAQKDSKNTNDL